MKTKSKRILVLPSWYPPDGGYFFKEHSEAISRQGWEVDVLVNRLVGARKLLDAGIAALKGWREGEENGLRVVRTSTVKLPGNEKLNIERWSRKTLAAYQRYEKAHGRPDLILAHSVSWAGYAASLIRESSAVPYVVVEHRSYFVWSTPEARAFVKDYHLPFYEKAYRDSTRVVPVAESLLAGLRALMPWIDEKVQVIPNMIREDMFLPPEKEPGRIPFVFFWAGRLEHVKGIDVLLDAVKELDRQSIGEFCVRLAGKGSLREALEQQARDLGVEDRVHFLGRIDRKAMQEEMQRASCFVLPTRYEAFGAVLIEAMATGLPVIATRSGGPDNIVQPENGLLVDVENPEQLAAAMARIMEHIGDFKSDSIRKHCLDRYGQTRVMTSYDELFRKILDQ